MRGFLLPLFLVCILVASALPSPATESSHRTTAPVVIAYVGEGINPYHVAFRAPTWTEHPSTFIPGYPVDAKPFPISLDVTTLEEAFERDHDLWGSLEDAQLYYVPGTRIVGVYFSGAYVSNNEWIRNFYETEIKSEGHGTFVADAGAGNGVGIAPDSAIVVVTGEGGGTGATRWVAKQEWIDIASISFSFYAGILPVFIDYPVLGWKPETPSMAPVTNEIAESGRLVFTAVGNSGINGLGLELQSDITGPPWTFSVGRLAGNESVELYLFCDLCGRPVDAVTFGEGCFARYDSITACRRGGGTSASTARMAGYAARLIRDARVALGDSGGFRDGYYAQAAPGAPLPATGPLADGRLDRTEVEDLLRKNADPDFPMDHERFVVQYVGKPPRPNDHDYLLRGYGAMMETPYQEARKVLLGEIPMPDRPQEDPWHVRMKSLAQAYWDPWICRNESPSEEWSTCYSDEYLRLLEAYRSTLPPEARELLPGP